MTTDDQRLMATLGRCQGHFNATIYMKKPQQTQLSGPYGKSGFGGIRSLEIVIAC